MTSRYEEGVITTSSWRAANAIGQSAPFSISVGAPFAIFIVLVFV
jgi:hypothetical protein